MLVGKPVLGSHAHDIHDVRERQGGVMPLTPEDVSNKRFTPVRLREGYDMGEVDQFLDEVESELSRLTRENEDLRGKLSTAQQGGAVSTPTPAEKAPEEEPDAAEDAADQTPAPVPAEPEPAPAPAAAPAPAPAPAAPTETIKVTTVADASSAAARLLEIATRNADELVTEARQEADRIVNEARTTSEQREAESKEKAERVESDARTRAQMLDSETAERRQQLFGDLERDRDKLNGDVENLRSFEREYRSRLKSYFEQQLAALDGSTEGAAPGDDHAPKRLRSLLAEDDEHSQNG
jgi:DivIVA domain-containing protein